MFCNLTQQWQWVSVFLFLRMLLPPSDLSEFNNTVTPIEVEAYDILKYRSSACDACGVAECAKQKELNQSRNFKKKRRKKVLFSHLCVVVRSPPLRSPTTGRAPRRRLITPIPGRCLLVVSCFMSLVMYHYLNRKCWWYYIYYFCSCFLRIDY